jgi:uncharacterized membrane protein
MDFQSDSPDTPKSNGERNELGATVVPDRRSARQLANRAFVAVKAQHAADRGPLERFAELLNDIASSTPFLVVHVVWFVTWISWNIGLLSLRPFDPYPFGLLTMVVSLEAIFLSIFVLLAQKREAAIAELREEIALQVGLWTEQEVTKSLQLITGLYRRLGHPIADDPELKEMLRPLDVKGIENRLVQQIEQTQRAKMPKAEKKPAE